MGFGEVQRFGGLPGTIGALIIRLGFWGPVYYNINKEI